ncbi:unnamed protein product [Acanthoscelides obtectus]|uniref:ZP domain-containing protein n=1 Tax=Acanthoscelides obtectus TaxID=200917 RepID=A0A9P0PRI0_ACAOB|nr:unnamed protein product [Acanthoscelides obtectus]CAK1629530.1 Cuticlin-1 [Acanthoscelides obtectus]
MFSPVHSLRKLLLLPIRNILFLLSLTVNASFAVGGGGGGGGDLWPMDRPDGMPSIQSLEVMCGKDHMDVHLTFSQPFEGIVSSKGQHGDPRCVYVPPSTGQTFFSFRIAYTRCGTKPDLHGQFYENTVVVQYDKDLLEVWDEAKRLRCEWFNDYEKTASKPPMVIADLDVIQLDFRGDNVDCWMEIQHGKGPWAPPVSGIVPLGSTLTLVVAINDYRGEFDMRVKSCAASDGGGHVIQLSDEFGCVLRPKMISRFLKARQADERATVITYAFFHAFKFPDALSVHIKCKVEICRHGCLEHCQLQPSEAAADVADPGLHHYTNPLRRQDDRVVSEEEDTEQRLPGEAPGHDLLYEEIIQDSVDEEEDSSSNEQSGTSSPVKMPLNKHQSEETSKEKHQQDSLSGEQDQSEVNRLSQETLPDEDIYPLPIRDKFPHGPRTFDDPIVAAPRSLNTDDVSTARKDSKEALKVENKTAFEKAHNRTVRRKRSVVVSDRKARSADVGVSTLYEVISEADLAFSPDGRAEAVTVFQGRIREEVVYGICMPVPGFSLLFVLVAVSAVVSALVAGTLLYRYQLQKEHLAQQNNQRGAAVPMSIFPNWMGLRLLRPRACAAARHQNGKMELNGKTRAAHLHAAAQ